MELNSLRLWEKIIVIQEDALEFMFLTAEEGILSNSFHEKTFLGKQESEEMRSKCLFFVVVRHSEVVNCSHI